MAHLGLVCPEVSGHLNPATTLARALMARGHRVTLFARPDAEPKARAAGLGFQAVGARAFPRGSIQPLVDRLGALEGWSALRFTLRMFRDSARAFLDDGPARLGGAGLDGLLIDEVCGAAEAVADEQRLPYVTICNALALASDPALPPPIFTWRYHPGAAARLRNRVASGLLDQLEPIFGGDIRRYRRARGLPPRPGLMRRAMIAQQPELLDFPRVARPPWFHYAGPFHDEASGDPTSFPFQRLDGRPVVFASMGTLQNRQRETFQVIAEGCAGLDLQLVMTLGRRQAAPDALGPLPGDPLVVSYAPQRALLQRAALAITHAGLNTALEALVQGVPMVAIPVTNDQPGVAARLAWRGVAEVIPLAQLEPALVRRSVQRVLSDPRYRDAAQDIRAQLAAIPGPTRAADIIEAALLSD
jgi:zeaxanthin glucosyltransferase